MVICLLIWEVIPLSLVIILFFKIAHSTPEQSFLPIENNHGSLQKVAGDSTSDEFYESIVYKETSSVFNNDHRYDSEQEEEEEAKNSPYRSYYTQRGNGIKNTY